MAWWHFISGKSIAEPIEAIGNVFDQLFTSDEERAQAQIVLERLRQHPAELQVELNKVEAKHRSRFVAGWRPAIGWVCALGLFTVFVINPWMQWFGKQPVDMPLSVMLELTLAMLGMGALRTFEKLKGVSK